MVTTKILKTTRENKLPGLVFLTADIDNSKHSLTGSDEVFTIIISEYDTSQIEYLNLTVNSPSQ